ncbi:hypothetical protein U1Q18_011415, partial [Sarracenia purpurea var. burkii]
VGGTRVFDGGVLWVELGGDIGFGDGGLVVGEGVALEASGVDPDEGREVDTGEGVKDDDACLAAESGVKERWDVQAGADRRD